MKVLATSRTLKYQILSIDMSISYSLSLSPSMVSFANSDLFLALKSELPKCPQVLTCFVNKANNFLLVHCILIVVKGSVKCNFTVLKRLVDSFYAMRDAGLSKSRALVVWLLPSGYIYFYSYRGMMDHHTKTNCALKLRPALLVACVLHHYLRAT